MRCAFTLIELMIVLAIIAILAAVIVPAVVNHPPGWMPAKAATLTIGQRVSVGESVGHSLGVVLSITEGGPEKPAMVRVRTRSTEGVYSEATFLVSELWVKP